MVERRKDGRIQRIEGRRRGEIKRLMTLQDPWCVMCVARKAQEPRLGVELDHVVALVNGGQDAPSNMQLLCKPCHRDKTAKDMGFKPRPRIGLDGYPTDS
jgi:5-methylcytosine-specific restriction protein A